MLRRQFAVADVTQRWLMFTQKASKVLVVVASTFPVLTTYCSIVLGSLMIDLGKATIAETNFPIARYRETTEWED